jgi:hypothetical protein
VKLEALNLDWLRKNQRSIRAELYGRSFYYFMDAYTMCTVAYNFALFALSLHFSFVISIAFEAHLMYFTPDNSRPFGPACSLSL